MTNKIREQLDQPKLRMYKGKLCQPCSPARKARNFRYKYGITLEQREETYTGKFRGLLCPNCNHGIGLFADDIARLQNAIAFLKYPPMDQIEKLPKPETQFIKGKPCKRCGDQHRYLDHACVRCKKERSANHKHVLSLV